MKPSESALNDWLKTIIVHKSFNNLHIYKCNPHFACIRLGFAQQYNYTSNQYEFTSIANIMIAVEEINGKLTNVVKFSLNMPTGFVDFSTYDKCKCERYTNITLKNLIEFVDFFREMYSKTGRNSLNHLYGIPNHNNMGYIYDYKPFKGGFDQYFKDLQKEYNKFLEYREILFSHLDKISKINKKKKDVEKDFVKE